MRHEHLPQAVEERLAHDTWEKAATSAREAVNHVYEYIGQPMLDLGSLVLGTASAITASPKDATFTERFGQRPVSRSFQEQIERKLTPLQISKLNDAQVAMLDRGYHADAQVFDDDAPDEPDLDDAVSLSGDEHTQRYEAKVFTERHPPRHAPDQPYEARILAERAVGVSNLVKFK